VLAQKISRGGSKTVRELLLSALASDRGNLAPDRPFAVLLDQFPNIVCSFCRLRRGARALPRDHALLEIEHLGMVIVCFVSLRRAVTVGPQVASDEVAQKVALMSSMCSRRCEPVLTLKSGFRLRESRPG